MPNIIEVLVQIKYFRGLAPKAIAELASAAIRSSHKAGKIIFLEGEPAQGMFLVGEGIVKVCRITKEGREHILHMIRPGDSFNDIAVLDGGPNPATAIAQTDVVVWCICRSALRRISRDHPDLAWALIESAAGRARYLVLLVEDLAMRSVKGRLARLLLEEAEASQTDVVPRLLTQEEMAARLGTVREMVGRTLRSLAADRIIEFDRHRIIVLDAERLAEEAEV